MSPAIKLLVPSLLVAATACESLLVEPAAFPSGVDVSLEVASLESSSSLESFGDLSGGLAGVRLVHLRLTANGVSRDTVLTATAGSEGARIHVGLRPEESRGWVSARVELRTSAQEPLFRGQGLFPPRQFSVPATIELTPVATLISVPPFPLITSVGDTIDLAGRAFFATGAPIDGAAVTWESSSAAVIEILSDSLAVSRSNGLVVLRASALGGSTDYQALVRQVPVLLSGVGPADTTIAPGATFVARAFGQDARGYPLLPGAEVTWRARGDVTVDLDGKVTAGSVGQGFVEAHHGSVVQTGQITVSP